MSDTAFVIYLLIAFVLSIPQFLMKREDLIRKMNIVDKKIEDAQKALDDNTALEDSEDYVQESFGVRRQRIENLEKNLKDANEEKTVLMAPAGMTSCLAEILLPAYVFCSGLYFSLTLFFNHTGPQMISLIAFLSFLIRPIFTHLTRNNREKKEREIAKQAGTAWLPKDATLISRLFKFSPNFYFIYAIVIIFLSGMAAR